MQQPSFLPVGASRALVALGLALTLATCRDGTGPGIPMARIAVAPILPSEAALADFGLTIDAVRFVVVRPAADTLADTTVALPPDATELTLDLRVPLLSNPEILSVSVVALSGPVPLFAGTELVLVPTPLPPPEIAVDTYVGPAADSIVIQPRSPIIFLNDSLRFQILGFNGGVPVTQFYVAWSTSDSTVAPINGFGVLRAPAARGSVRVRARTPSGASDSVTAVFAPPATQLVLIAGAGQAGTVGFPLEIPLEAEVRAADGLGVGGVAVRFRSLSGGVPADTTVPSDAAGRARVTGVLGPVAGVQSFEASAAGLAGSPVTFGVTALAGAATQLVATGGDLQSAIVGTAVATAPAVRAQDQYANPVAGASITFAVSGGGGGGSVTGGARLTNAAGIATVGGWALDTLAGTNTLTATAGALSAVFTATGVPAAPSRLLKVLGDSQTAVVNTAPAAAPTVRLTDRYRNPIAGQTIGFSGSGTVAAPTVLTDGSGLASAGVWTLATLAGSNALQATVTGTPTVAPVSFTATGTPDVAAQLLRLSVDSQSALINTAVPTPPAVAVADQYGNRLSGQVVQFVVTDLLGSAVTPPSASTDSTGAVRVTSWTLGATAGVNTLEARAGTLTGSPMVFKGLGFASPATTMALNGGDLQTAVVGRPLTLPYSVVVTGGAGAVPGVPVAWVVDSLGGTITATSTTDALGIATATRTLGGKAGVQTAFAVVNGLTGSPVRFTATALADTAFRIVKIAGDAQADTVGTLVTTAPSVRVTDAFGNPIAGVQVTFTPDAFSGIVTGALQTTDAAGVATVGGWTLGTGVGVQTLTAGAGTLSPVTFTAQATAGPPARLAFLAEPTRALAGDTIEPAVRVAIQDQFGNTVIPASDIVTLQLGVTPNLAAKLVGTLNVAAVSGIAVFPDLAIDSAGIGYTLAATTLKVAGAETKPFAVGGVIAAFASDRLQPVAAAFNPTNGLLYVPGVNSTLGVLDPNKGPISQLPILPSQPFGVAVNAQTNRVYVTTFALLAGAVVVIDAGTNSPILTIPLTGEGRGIAVDEATDRIYVAVAGDLQKLTPPSLAIIDGKDPRVIATIPFKEGAQAAGVAFNPKGGFVYVAIPDLGVGVFDPATLAHATTLPIVGAKGAAGTYGVTVDVRSNLIYATNRTEGTVSIIDAVALKEVQRLAVGLLPEGLGVDANRGVVYVGNSGDSTVSFIDAGKFNVLATLVVGPTPKAAAVDPVTGRVYVPTFGDDRVRTVQP